MISMGRKKWDYKHGNYKQNQIQLYKVWANVIQTQAWNATGQPANAESPGNVKE